MTASVQDADEATRDALTAVERRRQQALVDRDMQALDDLFDPSLRHTHAPGITHDKAQLMEHIATNQAYLGMERGDLDMRVIGDVAIVTGELTNHLRTKEGGARTLSGIVTQVLRRCDDGAWRYVTFQMTPYGERAWPALASERSRPVGDADDAQAKGPTGAVGAENPASEEGPA